jgi:hypothetical protein
MKMEERTMNEVILNARIKELEDALLALHDVASGCDSCGTFAQEDLDAALKVWEGEQ